MAVDALSREAPIGAGRGLRRSSPAGCRSLSGREALLGPFALAHLCVYGDRSTALGFLQPMPHHLADYGVGSLAEIFDGDPPFAPCGCIAQAWTVAETLRAWVEITAIPSSTGC